MGKANKQKEHHITRVACPTATKVHSANQVQTQKRHAGTCAGAAACTQGLVPGAIKTLRAVYNRSTTLHTSHHIAAPFTPQRACKVRTPGHEGPVAHLNFKRRHKRPKVWPLLWWWLRPALVALPREREAVACNITASCTRRCTGSLARPRPGPDQGGRPSSHAAPPNSLKSVRTSKAAIFQPPIVTACSCVQEERKRRKAKKFPRDARKMRHTREGS